MGICGWLHEPGWHGLMGLISLSSNARIRRKWEMIIVSRSRKITRAGYGLERKMVCCCGRSIGFRLFLLERVDCATGMYGCSLQQEMAGCGSRRGTDWII